MPLGGTDYVLVEFSTEAEYSKGYEGLREFVNAGYRPVLAHAERYRNLQNDLKGMQSLIESGVYIQVNARSFLGKLFNRGLPGANVCWMRGWCILLQVTVTMQRRDHR